jgi:hypothetical protein
MLVEIGDGHIKANGSTGIDTFYWFEKKIDDEISHHVNINWCPFCGKDVRPKPL